MPQPLRIALLAFVALGILGLFGYAMIRAIRRSEDPARFLAKCVFTVLIFGGLFWWAKGMVNSTAGAFILPFACVFVALVLTPLWAPDLARMLFRPITSMFDGGDEEKENPRPSIPSRSRCDDAGAFANPSMPSRSSCRSFPRTSPDR